MTLICRLSCGGHSFGDARFYSLSCPAVRLGYVFLKVLKAYSPQHLVILTG